jgi:putative ABC transport system substrate-binding protein
MRRDIFLLKVGIVVTLLGGIFTNHGFAEQSKQRKKIAICQIIDHAALDATLKGILDQLEESGFKNGEGAEIIYENAQGNVVTSSQIAQKFASLSPDVVVAISTPSAQSAMAYVKAAPIVFASVSDPLEAKLVTSLDHPDGLITGVSNVVSFDAQLSLMIELLPTLKTFGVVYNPGEANSVSLLKKMKEVASKRNIEVLESAASKTSEVAGATQSLINKVDAIFINNDNTALAAFESIVKVAEQAAKPVFASDAECAGRGAVAVLGPNQYQVGRQAGRVVTQLLNGIPARLIPVSFPDHMELHVNPQSAKKLNILIPEEVLTRAQKIL